MIAMRVCSKNPAHRRLGPVRCEAPGCYALVVEIDDPSDVSPGPPPGFVETADEEKDAALVAIEDSAEISPEPDDDIEELAPEPPLTVDRETGDASGSEAAIPELNEVHAVAAEELSPTSKQIVPPEPQPAILPELQKTSEPERADDLHVVGRSEARFAPQDKIKNVTVHSAAEIAAGTKEKPASLEPDLAAASDQPTSSVVAEKLKQSELATAPPFNPLPNDGQPIRPDIPQILQKFKRPAFAALAVATMLAASIGFYKHKSGEVRQEPVNPAELAWLGILNSHDPGDFREYIVKYPDSTHIDLAKQTATRLDDELRLADLNRVEQLAASRRAVKNAEPPNVPNASIRADAPPEQAAQTAAPPSTSSTTNSPSSVTPSEVAREVVEALKAQGMLARGYIGVQTQPVTPEIAESLGLKSTYGALVAVARPNAPAAKAGIISGDVITSVNGEPVERPRDLASKIAAIGPNVLVNIGFIHDGLEKTATVKLGRLSNDRKVEANASAEKSAATALASLGLSLSPANAVASAGADGVVVTQIDPEGAAAKKGFRSGDVILEAGGKPVTVPEDVVAALKEARKEGSRPLLLRIKSGDILHFLTLPSDES